MRAVTRLERVGRPAVSQACAESSGARESKRHFSVTLVRFFNFERWQAHEADSLSNANGMTAALLAVVDEIKICAL